MSSRILSDDISIRTELRAGDLGHIVQRHGIIYKEEYNYGIEFESYVAGGLNEFYKQYDPSRDRVWFCEHKEKIVGFVLLMHRPDNSSQLRYFLLEKEYRGIGLGKKLMDLLLAFHHQCGYSVCYLWTTNEQAEAAALYMRYGFKLTEEKDSSAFSKALKEQKYELR